MDIYALMSSVIIVCLVLIFPYLFAFKVDMKEGLGAIVGWDVVMLMLGVLVMIVGFNAAKDDLFRKPLPEETVVPRALTHQHT